ncbi:MAG: Electron transport complex subunit RsxG [Candidatus Marinimicrobia bacterium]|nr:Electron transport complex subunit RsxG [Candidatus Neomarinimicrobiota bacterium]
MKQLLCSIFVFLTPLVFAQQDVPADVDLGPEQYLMTPEEAVGEIFGQNYSTEFDTISVSQSARTQIENELHRAVPDTQYVVRKIYQNNNLTGYAMVINEYGKYRPITLLVGVDAEFNVEGVRILVYRENRGGEVQRQRFLYQYRGKSSDEPIRINRDIINISGATISVRGVNAGVRRVLHLIEWHYGDGS